MGESLLGLLPHTMAPKKKTASKRKGSAKKRKTANGTKALVPSKAHTDNVTNRELVFTLQKLPPEMRNIIYTMIAKEYFKDPISYGHKLEEPLVYYGMDCWGSKFPDTIH